jgi:hypothetical protein
MQAQRRISPPRGSFTLASFFYPDLDETRRSLGLEASDEF